MSTTTAGIQENVNASPPSSAGTGGAIVDIPSGVHTIYEPITLDRQIWLRGQGKTNTILVIPPEFPLTSQGVIVAAPPGGPIGYLDGGMISDLTLRFTQPNSASPADFIHYPPGVNIQSGPHFTIRDVIMEMPWIGIQAAVDNNGFTVKDVGMSPLSIGISAPAIAYDTVLIDNLHIWPYGTTGDQTAAFLAAPAIGVYVNNAADLKLINSSLFCGTGGYSLFVVGPSGVFISDCWFDGYGNMNLSGAASVSIKGCYLLGQGSVPSMGIAGGAVINIDHTLIYSQTSAAAIQNAVNGPSPNAAVFVVPSLTIRDSQIIQASVDANAIRMFTLDPYTGPAHLDVHNVSVFKNPSQAFAQPVVYQLQGDVRVDLEGLKINDLAGGSGVALNLATDTYHNIGAVVAPGYTVVWPPTATKFRKPG